MNKNEARKLAMTITNEELQHMFESAKAKITNWNQVSSVNKGMTKGTAWNILAKDFDVNKEYHNLAKVNMIREFGDYLPNKRVFKTKTYTSPKPPVHQEPDFDAFE